MQEAHAGAYLVLLSRVTAAVLDWPCCTSPWRSVAVRVNPTNTSTERASRDRQRHIMTAAAPIARTVARPARKGRLWT
jgi:hypothetical protein